MNRLAMILAVLLAAPACGASSTARGGIEPALAARLSASAIPFIPNAGQWDRRAAFAAPMFAGTLFVTGEGQLVYRLNGQRQYARSRMHRPSAAAGVARTPDWVLVESFVDADRQPLVARPHGSLPQPGSVSYAGSSSAGRPHGPLGTFGEVRFGPVFPGIEVALRATGANVEKVFTVAPGGDPARIRIRLDGATALALGDDGSLVAMTGNGPVTYTAPVAYQESKDEQRRAVPVSYAIDPASGTYAFALGDYDRALPLVIDPLLQSTYAGGTGSDVGNAIAIHPATGQVFLAGTTNSTDFPGTTGGAQAAASTATEGFIARFDPTLTTRLQSTYLGGSGANDEITAIAIHPLNGGVYVAGATDSTDLPGTTGGAQAAKAAGTDAFVARFNPALTILFQATYLGGGSADIANAIAIHPVSGDVYVAGQTQSADFPGTTGGAQAVKAALSDAFVARLSPDLKTLRQSTYLGGGANDYAYALAVNLVNGDILTAGFTASADFPGVAGGAQTAASGGFVTRLNHRLTSLEQSTYFGGSATDVVNGVAALSGGDVVIAASSDAASIPGIPGSSGGSTDAVVALLGGPLTSILNGARINGSGSDQAVAIAVHPASGEIYVAGTTSSAPPFPGLAGGAQTTYSGSAEAFIARFDTALTLQQSTYFGALLNDEATAMAIHPLTGDVYTAGSTNSTSLPGSIGAAQALLSGPKDAFIARHTFDLRNAAVAQPAAFGFPSIFGATPGALQTSAPATISGLGVSPQTIAIMNGNLAFYCISSTASCSCDVATYSSGPHNVANGQSICVRQYAPPVFQGGATATVLVGGGSANFFVGTGSGGCSLDVDGNGAQDALTDGLIVLRAMFGLTGTSVTNGVIGGGATRTTWAQLQPYLNGNCGSNFQP